MAGAAAGGASGGPSEGSFQSNPASGGAASGGTTIATVENENIMAALAYLLIPAIIFLVVEPYNRNRFIRFHSFQSLFYCAASIVLQVLLGVLSSILAMVGIGFVIAMLMPIVSLALFALWILLVVKAYQGQEWRMPLIGDWAAKQV